MLLRRVCDELLRYAYVVTRDDWEGTLRVTLVALVVVLVVVLAVVLTRLLVAPAVDMLPRQHPRRGPL